MPFEKFLVRLLGDNLLVRASKRTKQDSRNFSNVPEHTPLPARNPSIQAESLTFFGKRKQFSERRLGESLGAWPGGGKRRQERMAYSVWHERETGGGPEARAYSVWHERRAEC